MTAYKHTITPFGAYEKYTLQSTDGLQAISFVPQVGGCTLSLRLGGIEVLDGYQTPEELEVLSFSKNVFLYPFPNRLQGGTYAFAEKTYQFPINDKSGNNAIHGFGRKAKLAVSSVELSTHFAKTTLTHYYQGENKAYPFPMQWSVQYALHPTGAEITMLVKNTGDTPLPIGLGWHPYFKLTDPLADCVLQMPACRQVNVDADMIPTGETHPVTEWQDGKIIGNTQWDTCFALPPQTPQGYTLQLRDAKHTLVYHQEQNCPFVQLFTPAHRQSIAIEPMTCNINALNNGEGLWVLPVGKTMKTAVQLSVHKK